MYDCHMCVGCELVEWEGRELVLVDDHAGGFTIVVAERVPTPSPTSEHLPTT